MKKYLWMAIIPLLPISPAAIGENIPLAPLQPATVNLIPLTPAKPLNIKNYLSGSSWSLPGCHLAGGPNPNSLYFSNEISVLKPADSNSDLDVVIHGKIFQDKQCQTLIDVKSNKGTWIIGQTIKLIDGKTAYQLDQTIYYSDEEKQWMQDAGYPVLDKYTHYDLIGVNNTGFCLGERADSLTGNTPAQRPINLGQNCYIKK